MGEWLRIAGWSFVFSLTSQRDLALENIALRQQLMVLQRQTGKVQLRDRDRLFWVWLRRLWPGWRRALVLVQPATVVGWHRKGFRAYWRWKSRARGGRPRIDPSVWKLIRHMWSSNPTWGAPRIQAELRKIGIEVSDSTVRRYRPPRLGPPSQAWRSFLHNHLAELAAIDFFIEFFVVTHFTTRRRERTARWTTTVLICVLLNRPRWALWSSIRRSADSITGTDAGSRPDLPDPWGSLTVHAGSTDVHASSTPPDFPAPSEIGAPGAFPGSPIGFPAASTTHPRSAHWHPGGPLRDSDEVFATHRKHWPLLPPFHMRERFLVRHPLRPRMTPRGRTQGSPRNNGQRRSHESGKLSRR